MGILHEDVSIFLKIYHEILLRMINVLGKSSR